jgi:hypothetical protein
VITSKIFLKLKFFGEKLNGLLPFFSQVIFFGAISHYNAHQTSFGPLVEELDLKG